jgi:hypothetical protein
VNRRIAVRADMIPAQMITRDEDDIRSLTRSQSPAGLIKAGAQKRGQIAAAELAHWKS